MDFNQRVLKVAVAVLCDLLLPRVCVVCGRRLIYEEKHICYRCLSDLPLTHFWERSHQPMADKFNERLIGVSMDGDPERYAWAAALFFYNSESGYRRIPWDLKYRQSLGQGRYFARMLGERLAGSEQFADVDTVIPVPLHWTRRLRRGYNQAEIIAEEVAEALRADLRTDVLRRVRRTRTQTRVDVKAKSTNVSGAFAISRTGTDTLRGVRHVLLIDDTFTTGATLAACFATLRQALPTPVRISCATLDFVTKS